MSMRIKALFIAVVMGAAVISGIAKGLSSPRRVGQKAGAGNEEKGPAGS